MLNNDIFYHATIRKTIVAFGSLFSDIKITRESPEGDSQTISIPISYAPKEKWIVRIDQDPTLDKHVYTTLPRMSFEITNYNYDATRKTNRTNYITCADENGNLTRTYAPVPYNIDISLYVLTKTTEDGLQIIEQILPFFMPEFTLAIKALPESNVITDIPVILNSLDVVDDYDGDFQTRRFVTHTLNFTLKTWMFGPVTGSGVINRVFVNTDIANLDIDGDVQTGDMIVTWNEDLDID